MKRGRPKISEAVLKEKRVETFYENKNKIGEKSIWHYDRKISTHGAYKVEHILPKNYYTLPIVEVNKQQSYGGMPVVMVFKTSNRSNAKTKMKIWNNTNIDYINTAKKLPGVPEKAEILELGVGESFIAKWQSKYNL